MINILISGNDTYAFGTKVFLTSLLENSGKHGLTIYFLYNKLSDQNKEDLKKIVEKYSACKLEFLFIEASLFSEMPLKAITNPYITIETYFRLAMEKVLPRDIEKILYLDTDIIVNRDLSAIYNTKFNEEVAAVVCEDFGITMAKKIKKRVYNNLGFNEDYKYFNAGVILFNVNYIRKNLPFSKFIEFINNNYDKLIFHDQDVLNANLRGHIQYLDYKIYNCRPFFFPYKRKYETKIRKTAVIIHYGEKPWDSSFSDLCGEIFWKYAIAGGYSKEYEEWKDKNKQYCKKNRISIGWRHFKRNVKALCNL